MTYQPSRAKQLMLAAAFTAADEAGYGVWDGERFEAYPGQFNAAADYIAAYLGAEEDEQ